MFFKDDELPFGMRFPKAWRGKQQPLAPQYNQASAKTPHLEPPKSQTTETSKDTGKPQILPVPAPPGFAGRTSIQQPSATSQQDPEIARQKRVEAVNQKLKAAKERPGHEAHRNIISKSANRAFSR